jgi:predicted DNA-binding transcriptional regulator YafY
MQINRLFEIIYILLNRKPITAKKLSERFEVSVRTIYRDIDTLCAAGVPIYTTKGKGGGIGLDENFVLNKSVLSDKEQNEILTALQSLNAIKYPDIDHVISKLGALFNKSDASWIDVDFSHWGSQDMGKFNQLRMAIINAKTIDFEYFSTYGEKTNRRVEPLQLWFKDKSWYLKGYCLSKQAFRIFKLARMKNLQTIDRTFDRESLLASFDEPIKDESCRTIRLKLHIQPCAAYRVYDEFDENEITNNEDGSFTVTVSYPEDEWVYGYILSFGSNAEVIEPQYARELIRERLEAIMIKYR